MPRTTLFARARRATGRAAPLADVQLLAPLVPAAIRDFVAFEEHVEGVSAAVDGKSEVVPEWYQAPTFYFTNPHTVLGPGEPVAPPVTERLDFELELAVVIGGVAGSDGANLTPEAAASHIFGYTIMNDWSARDLQSREMKVRLGPAKGKDFGTTLGPWIVTADELEPFLDEDGFLAVRAEVFVNGELDRRGPRLEHGLAVPRARRLRGAQLAGRAGRRARIGHGRQRRMPRASCGDAPASSLRRRCAEGDEVRMVVEGIGELVARVGAAVPAPELPAARRRSRARSRDHRCEGDHDMTERLVSHLRYAALAVPNFEEERTFFTKYWGLTEVHAEDGLSYLAAEGSTEPFILRLRADDKRIDLVGFAVADRDDLHALAEKLRSEDVQFVHEPQELTGFGGGYGFRVFDGDGRVLEFSTGYQTREARKIREREPIPSKLSHVVFNSANLNQSAQWYIDHLDFSISDSLTRPTAPT